MSSKYLEFSDMHVKLSTLVSKVRLFSLKCVKTRAHHIAPPVRSGDFKAEVFLRVFPQAAVHLHAVALNVELPFLLLVW